MKIYHKLIILFTIIVVALELYVINSPVIPKEIDVPIGILHKMVIDQPGVVFDGVVFPRNLIFDVKAERVVFTNCILSVDYGWRRPSITFINVTNSFATHSTLSGYKFVTTLK